MRNQPLTQGEKLALARKHHRPPMNQMELAELLGVTRSAVARWEVSETLPSKAIALIYQKFGVTPEWIRDPSDAPPRESGEPRLIQKRSWDRRTIPGPCYACWTPPRLGPYC